MKVPQTELMQESLERLKTVFGPILIPFTTGIFARERSGESKVNATAVALEVLKSHPTECANFIVCAVQVIAAMSGDCLGMERRKPSD